MIKLVVTDMDGCLLDGRGNMPSDFADTFKYMQEKGVILAAASGRSIAGLMKPFGDAAKDMAFASDNGACAYYKGEQLFANTLKPEDYLPIIAEARKHPGVRPVGCGTRDAWMEDIDKLTDRDITELSKYYPTWQECGFESVPDDIIKIALLYFDDIEKNIYPFYEKYNNDKILCKVTSYVWIDVFDSRVSKGTGVKALQEKLGISPEETVVFGDYLNDLPMADYAARSFAPANAHPDVKARFTDIIGSNEEASVTRTIREIL